MIHRDIIKNYLSAGKKLIPLNPGSKVPKEKNWTKVDFTDEDIYNHDGNLGWAIGPNELVVDIDPKNGGDASFERIKSNLGIDLIPTIRTPSGGYHIYLDFPKGYAGCKIAKTANTKEEYPGIDFLGHGSQCLILGCYNRDLDAYYTQYDDLEPIDFSRVAPEEIMDLVAKNPVLDGGEDFLMMSGSTWTEEQVREMLWQLDPDCDYDSWTKLGMALKLWDPIRGLEIWDEWSSEALDKYEKGLCKKKWSSFKPKIGGVTMGTFYYMSKKAKSINTENIITSISEKISKSDMVKLELDIYPQIRKFHFEDFNLDRLAFEIQSRIKDLTGNKPKIGICRNFIKPNIGSGDYNTEEFPDWCNNFCYVSEAKSFFDCSSLLPMSETEFNLLNGINIPLGPNGSKPSALKYVADRGYVKRVDSIAYMPFEDDNFVELEGKTYLNTFNKKTVPAPAKHYTESGHEACKAVERHINFICNGEEYGKIFLCWLAHQIKHKGIKILWAPVIQSIQGIGKSFFEEILSNCLGRANVGVIGPNEFSSQFNGWAMDKCVNVIEEIKITGKTRHDSTNALKTLITNPRIQVNKKNINQINTLNTCNYVLFTNYKDAIPIPPDDRRFFIINNELESLSQIKEIMGVDHVIYYERLFKLMRDNISQINKWLTEYDIPESFYKLKIAPLTKYKEMLIATEECSIHGYHELKEFIEKGGQYYNSLVVSSPHLFEDFLMNYGYNIQTTTRNVILKKLGFMKHKSMILINKQSCSIWCKRPMTNKEIQSIFKYGLEFLE